MWYVVYFKKIDHPEEFLDVLSVIGSDARYQKIKENYMKEIEKGDDYYNVPCKVNNKIGVYIKIDKAKSI
ncbi:MAG: hypothetical protein K2M46_00030 [Lachnospiraceae bacterium]|nr:hypothetical protein [Lachnospiraceae bacterium]